MQQMATAGALVRAFLVGYTGWLLAAVLPPNGWLVVVAAVLIGFSAGLLAGRPLGWVAMLLGFAAAYPIAFFLGIFVFLGENWWVAAFIFGLAATVGYWLGLFVWRRSQAWWVQFR
jgi:hypothetical protein